MGSLEKLHTKAATLTDGLGYSIDRKHKGMKADYNYGQRVNVELEESEEDAATPSTFNAQHPFKDDDTAEYDMDDGYIAQEAYDIIRSIVPDTDDTNQPVVTFRVILLGSLFGALLTVVNTVFTFRTNYFNVNSYFVLMISYPLGTLMYWTLSPRIYRIPYFHWNFTFNPGPFSYKEHALIYICSRIAGNPSYALYNIISQRYLLGQPLSISWCILFAIVSQVLGYGIAGLCRKVLVRPAVMLWPSTLTVIATLRSLHGQGKLDNETKDSNSDTLSLEGSRKNDRSQTIFFWICACGMFVYQWFPAFFAPLLGSVSVLCLAAPFNKTLRILGSSRQGVGLLSFSFDWSIIGQLGPIISPLWAICNQYVGFYVFIWILIPILWTRNAFGADQILGTSPFQGPNGTGQFPLGHALNSPSLFNRYGLAISPLDLVFPQNGTLVLNQAAYDANKPIYVTTFYAVQYIAFFTTFSASLMHALVWYGKDIWNRLKTAAKDLDLHDIQAQMMDKYLEVPNTWYVILLVSAILGALSCGSWGGFDLQWWGVFLSVFTVIATIIPLGIVEAISGQRVATNVEAEILFGAIQPGRIASLMSFKTLSYVGTFQALAFLEDLKLGHYAKIPPRAMFFTQLITTVISTVINVVVATTVYERIGVEVMNEGRLLGWNSYTYQIFLSSGTIWGTIGTEKFFGRDSPYFPCLLGFAVGLLAPLIFYLLHRVFPHFTIFAAINVPLIAVFHTEVGSMHSDLITPLLVALTMNLVVKKVANDWWSKYAFVMSSALDMSAAIVSFLVLGGMLIAPQLFRIPYYFANRYDGEGCASEAFLLCHEGNRDFC